jgi:hypothetical protein
MHSSIKITGRTATIAVQSGWGFGPNVRLTGSTYPTIPVGMIVERLSVEVPSGLQAIAFFCNTTEPRRVGSGSSAYTDRTPILSASVLLSWEEDDKLIIKADQDMSASELARFNGFVRTSTDVFVTDVDHKIVYTSKVLEHDPADPTWIYKSVQMNSILEYVTKKLTMEELDQRAESEQQVLDEMQGLREHNRILQGLFEKWATRAEGFEYENKYLVSLLDELNGYRNCKSFRNWWPLCSKSSVRSKLGEILARSPDIKRAAL